ncbi:MAG: 2'-deoxycytidine 5'-triphosphate deaminase [Planctomycetota bacterium]|nr:MAG: 2'-deoxycytidine 5'-triphosphate deaminase [Planctomycetota bacterium]
MRDNLERPMPRSLGHVLVDAELRELARGGAIRAATPLARESFQPASLDLRLSGRALRIRAGFLPERTPLSERLAELATSELSLDGRGAVLERGLIYLVELEEEFALPRDVHARFNPRSSTGRCDLFTRVLVEGHPRFDEAPAGWRGKPWIEIAPLSFPVRLRRGDRLCQVRLLRGRAALSRDELEARYAREPLCFLGRGARQRPVPLDALRIDAEGALELRVGLAERDPCAWRASSGSGVVEFAKPGAHRRDDFWEPVHAKNGHCILEPGRFYILASRERLRVPPDLCAEMLPVDVGVGELRNNYAGFFDNGFGWELEKSGKVRASGTPAVLEVRAHDFPFLVEDGQSFCRLKFFRSARRPQQVYGEGRKGARASYRGQDLTLARVFRA